MSKELFVSSTPHETKVAIVEDDQLTEIYFERENEYTLAGSIYKGRVTRVLPGMQSAFVDIGLERDAFLYVSDFLEEQEDQEEFEQVVSKAHEDATRNQVKPETPVPVPPPAPVEAAQELGREAEQMSAQPPAQPQRPAERDANFQDRPWRGRRHRRGGRRGFPESKFVRQERPREPVQAAPPPSDYQPIILPGESISKYQHLAQHPSAPATTDEIDREGAGPGSEAAELAASMESLPQTLDRQVEEERDEYSRDQREQRFAAGVVEEHEREAREPEAHLEEREERLDQMNVAAVFGGEAAEEEPAPREEQKSGPESAREPQPQPAPAQSRSFTPGEGVLEEEEIEEEEPEAGFESEEVEESEFEELEEETFDRDHGNHIPVVPVLQEVRETEAEEAAEAADMNGAEEAEEEDEEEEEEGEAEAEEVKATGEGDSQAEMLRAETRAPAGTAGFQQRTDRAADQRRRGRRGGRRMRTRRNIQRGPAPKITDLLKEGQEVLVQIAKEPMGKKGARITSHIALPGRFLVYMPTVNHIGVSRKIASEEERHRLKRIILAEHEGGVGGFIVRTAAAGASEDDLRADVRFLLNLWAEIRSRAESSKPPALIYHDLNLVERILRDQVTQNFTQIWVDTEQEYERVLRFVSRFQSTLLKRVKLYTKETPLFEQFNIQDELNKALKSKVWLKSGGYIVINQTEALVAIDINTGKYVGKTARLEDTIVKTNIDAIREIVRQIRLRDLGGIIVIDFIDMDERKNRQKVMQALEDELRHDRAPSKVLAFNDFGLVAITRKRVKQSLERTLGSPCPYCTGTGLVKSVTTICNEIYVEMRKISKHLDRSDVVVRVNPEVAKALKGNNARLLQEMEELTNRSVIVKSDPTLHQEQFDIN
jgi:ribonuclease G